MQVNNKYVIVFKEEVVDIMERLQKIIASSGLTSRRKAEELIKKGRVKVNGEVVYEMGIKVDNKAIIEVDGKELNKEEKVYYLLNKPRGVVTTTSDDKHRKTVIDLIEEEKRIYPIGRLDYDTTGVLLLTNDGEFANYMMHPKNKVDKVYIAKVEGIATGDNIVPLKKGIKLDNAIVKATRCKLRSVDNNSKTSIIELTIHDGKNHQVKRMLECVGLPVIKLKRERIAFLTLDGLKSGEYRKLTKKEVSKLYNLANQNKK